MNNFKIAEYDEFTAKLNEIKEAANFLPDVSTKDGYEKSKRVSLDIGKVKTKLDKVRKEQKQYWSDGAKLVDSQAKEILVQLNEMQEPHLGAYKELDKLKKQLEVERKEKLEVKVLDIVNLPVLMQDSHSSEIAGAIESLQNNECLDFYEFSSAALKARNESKQQLTDLFAKRLQEEKDASELEELRAKQAIQDQKDHDARIAQQASEQAEKDKQEAIEREEQAKRDQLKAEQDKIEADKRLIEWEKQSKIEQENARIKAEEQMKQAAEDARLAEVARKEAEEEQERERIAELEANKAHVSKIRKQTKESLMLECGLDEETAKKVTTALSKKLIDNCLMSY